MKNTINRKDHRMDRDTKKYIAEGRNLIKKHMRMDMTYYEMRYLMEKATTPGGDFFALADAFCLGVAVGAKIKEA